MKKTGKIVVLDSDSDMVNGLELSLIAEGYEVVSAVIRDFSSGLRDVVEFIKVNHPAVVIYDVVPPVLQNARYLEIMMLAGLVDPETLIVTCTLPEELKQLTGINSFELLPKPFNLDELLTVVAKKIKTGIRKGLWDADM